MAKIRGRVGNHNETLNGSNQADDINGRGGNDIINSLGGDDVSAGDLGNDLIHGNQGDDKLFGDAGNDKLYGDQGNDILHGGLGNDTLYGGDDDDKLFGDTGNDILYGDAGNDELQGDLGDDKLSGGAGNDILTGGLGRDQFIFKSPGAFKIGSATNDIGIDTITGFDNNDGLVNTVPEVNVDTIALSKTTFTQLAADRLNNVLDKELFASVTNNNDAQFQSAPIVYNSSTGELFYNFNGIGAGFADDGLAGGLFAIVKTGNAPASLRSVDFRVVA